MPWESLRSVRIVPQKKMLRQTTHELQFVGPQNQRIDGIPTGWGGAEELMAAIEFVSNEQLGHNLRENLTELLEESKYRSRRRLVAVASAVLLPTMFGTFTLFNYWEHQRWARFSAHAVTTIGRVLHETHDASKHLYWIEYAFSDPQHREHYRSTNAEEKVWEERVPKNEVEIAYLPTDPDENHLAEGEMQIVSEWVNIGGAVLFVLTLPLSIIVCCGYDVNYARGRWHLVRQTDLFSTVGRGEEMP